MTIDAMITVKDAAALLGCDKRAVREKLELGQLKGEKRLDGDKEKWFVQRQDLDKELASKDSQIISVGPKPVVRRKRKVAKPESGSNNLFFGIDVTAVETTVVPALEAAVESVIEAEATEKAPSNEEPPAVPEITGGKSSLAAVVQVMAREFARRLEEQRSFNLRLIEELEAKDSQLRLLPDLQRKADEIYKVEFEAAALRRQIECIEDERNNTLVALQRAEQETIPQLRGRLQEEYTQHSLEVMRLREQLQIVSKRRQDDEQHKQNITELETALHEVLELQQRDKRLARDEIKRVQRDKALEIAKLNERISQLTEQKQKVRELEANLRETLKVKEEEQAKAQAAIDRVIEEKDQEKFAVKAELEAALLDVLERREQEKQALKTEIDETLRVAIEKKDLEIKAAESEARKVQEEKAQEILALNSRLAQMTAQLEEARKPWWRKMFGS